MGKEASNGALVTEPNSRSYIPSDESNKPYTKREPVRRIGLTNTTRILLSSLLAGIGVPAGVSLAEHLQGHVSSAYADILCNHKVQIVNNSSRAVRVQLIDGRTGQVLAEETVNAKTTDFVEQPNGVSNAMVGGRFGVNDRVNIDGHVQGLIHQCGGGYGIKEVNDDVNTTITTTRGGVVTTVTGTSMVPGVGAQATANQTVNVNPGTGGTIDSSALEAAKKQGASEQAAADREAINRANQERDQARIELTRGREFWRDPWFWVAAGLGVLAIAAAAGANNYRRRRETVIVERDTAQGDLATRTTERNQARTDLAAVTTERNNLQGQVTNLTNDLNTRTTERDTARADLVTRTTERDNLQTQVTNLTNDLNARTTERDNALAERDTARTERDTARTERDTARNDLNARTTERDNAITARDAAIIERDNAQVERDQARVNLAAMTTERDNAITEKDQARTGLTAMTTERNNLQTQVTTLSTDLNTRTTERDTLQTQVTNLTNDLNTRTADLQAAQQQAQNLNNDLTVRSTELATVRAEVIRTEGERDTAVREFREYKRASKKRDDVIKELKRILAKPKPKLAQVRQAVDQV